jgi:hypothetical protein
MNIAPNNLKNVGDLTNTGPHPNADLLDTSRGKHPVGGNTSSAGEGVPEDFWPEPDENS